MKKTTVLGKTIVFAGLSLVVVLGICGFRSNWTTVKLAGKSASITELDQRARPFFEEAQRNVPAAVAKLTETKTMLKLCWYEFPGKTNDRESQALIQSILEKPIFEPCRKGAAVYGCAINKGAASDSIAEIGKSAVVTTLYSAGGLGLEAVFMRSTLKSMKTIIKAASGRLSKFLGAGAACAAADGPFPFGDTIGVTLAVGGTWLCIRDLKAVQKDLAGALEEAILQAIDEYWKQCRLEAIR